MILATAPFSPEKELGSISRPTWPAASSEAGQVYGMDLDVAQYFHLPYDTILLLNGEVGVVSDWSDDPIVPIFDRLYLGGASIPSRI